MLKNKINLRLRAITHRAVFCLCLFAVPSLAYSQVKTPVAQATVARSTPYPASTPQTRILHKPTTSESLLPFRSGEVIVKLRKPSTARQANQLANQKLNPQNISPNLSSVFEKLHVADVQEIGFAAPKAEQFMTPALANAFDFPASDEVIEAVRLKCSARRQRELSDALPQLPQGVLLLKLEKNPGAANNNANDQGQGVKEAVRLLQMQPEVEYAQPNYIYRASDQAPAPIVSTDPFASSSTNITKTIGASYAWPISQGQGITVAIVDTGVNRAHTDLDNNIWTNSSEIPGNCIDDDNNGFVDDVYGWSFSDDPTYGEIFLRGSHCPLPAPLVGDREIANETMDCNGHGTRTAGIVAAELNNGVAIAGVAPKAKIMPVKVLDDEGTTTTAVAVQGIWYAAANCADVINNSWDSSKSDNDPLLTSVSATVTALGTSMVFSAGNDGDSGSYHREVQLPGVISVASASSPTTIRSTSIHGHMVDLIAPGEQIRSTTTLSCGSPPWPAISDTALSTGTSIAAPHVSGTIALMLSKYPTLTPLEVRGILRSAATGRASPFRNPFLAGGGFDTLTSHGLLDARRSIAYSSAVNVSIAEPTDLSIFPQNQSQGLNIRGDAYAGNFAYYEIQMARSDFHPPQWELVSRAFEPVVNDILGTIDIRTLAAGRYLVRVVARDSDGYDFDDVRAFTIERPNVREVATIPDQSKTEGLFLSANWMVYPSAWAEGSTIMDGLELYSRTLNQSSKLAMPEGYTSFPPEEVTLIADRWIVWTGNGKNNNAQRVGSVAMYDLTTKTFSKVDEQFHNVRFLTAVDNRKVLWIRNRDDSSLLSDVYVAELDINPPRVTLLLAGAAQEGFEWPVVINKALLLVKQTRVSPPSEVYRSQIYIYDVTNPADRPTVAYTAPLTEFIRAFHGTNTEFAWVSENFSATTGLSTGETLRDFPIALAQVFTIGSSQGLTLHSPVVTSSSIYWIDAAAATEGYGTLLRYNFASGVTSRLAQTSLKKGEILRINGNSAAWHDTDAEHTRVKLLSTIN